MQLVGNDMDILIDTNSIRAKATELERLMKELDRKNDSLDKINLDDTSATDLNEVDSELLNVLNPELLF